MLIERGHQYVGMIQPTGTIIICIKKKTCFKPVCFLLYSDKSCA